MLHEEQRLRKEAVSLEGSLIKFFAARVTAEKYVGALAPFWKSVPWLLGREHILLLGLLDRFGLGKFLRLAALDLGGLCRGLHLRGRLGRARAYVLDNGAPAFFGAVILGVDAG